MAINYRSRAVSNSKVGQSVLPYKTPKYQPEAKLKASKAQHNTHKPTTKGDQ